MGLSGSGKSELAKELHKLFQQHEKSSQRLNADEIRSIHNDWDFSVEGRLRQARRIAQLANLSKVDYAIADFIAPTQEIRDIFNADMLIWLDTVKSSKYDDTDAIFQKPKDFTFKIKKKDAKKWASTIYDYIKKRSFK